MGADYISDISFNSVSMLQTTSALISLTGRPFIYETGSVFTNLSLEPTWRWYFVMTPFETVFLFLIIAQVG